MKLLSFLLTLIVLPSCIARKEGNLISKQTGERLETGTASAVTNYKGAYKLYSAFDDTGEKVKVPEGEFELKIEGPHRQNEYDISLSVGNHMSGKMIILKSNDYNDGHLIRIEDWRATRKGTRGKIATLEKLVSMVMPSAVEVYVHDEMLTFNGGKGRVTFEKTKGDYSVAPDLQKAFNAYIAAIGEVPDKLQHKIPLLQKNEDDYWHWNRMVDNPKYNGPTDQPINTFTWEWTPFGLLVINNENTMAGDYQSSILLSYKGKKEDTGSRRKLKDGAVALNLQESFDTYIASAGKVPKNMQHMIPLLMKNTDGSWHWNRMVDNPEYDGPTGQPINTFTWEWTTTGLLVTNHESTMIGTSKSSILLS